MKKLTIIPECRSCVHWRYKPKYANDTHVGRCERYPPVLVVPSAPGNHFSWETPVTASVEICGEYKPAKKPAVMLKPLSANARKAIGEIANKHPESITVFHAVDISAGQLKKAGASRMTILEILRELRVAGFEMKAN